MLQLYVLKLLKMQTKYLGRQWRKSNMKTMSAIYTKVNHTYNAELELDKISYSMKNKTLQSSFYSPSPCLLSQ